MLNLNKVVLSGYLGADPEVKTFQNNGRKVTLRVATQESWTKNGERQTRTEWHSVELHTETDQRYAEQFLRKGSPVYIEGQITTRKYNDNAGQERSFTCISVSRYGKLTGLDRRNGEDQPRNGGRSQGHEDSRGGDYERQPSGDQSGYYRQNNDRSGQRGSSDSSNHRTNDGYQGSYDNDRAASSGYDRDPEYSNRNGQNGRSSGGRTYGRQNNGGYAN